MKSVPDPERKLRPEEVENLSAYLDQELNEEDAEKVSAALSSRPEVRQEAESLRKTWELLDYLPRPRAPQTFTEQTLTRLNSTKGLLLLQGQKWRRYAIAGWAAALILAAFFGFWLTYSAGKPPEIVEVSAPVQDVLPAMEITHPEPIHTAATSTSVTDPKLPRKDFRIFNRSSSEREAISKQRNERLTREIGKVLNELRRKATEEERNQLVELSRDGGLPYLARVIELAKKYDISLKAAPPAAETSLLPGKNNLKKQNRPKDGPGE